MVTVYASISAKRYKQSWNVEQGGTGMVGNGRNGVFLYLPPNPPFSQHSAMTHPLVSVAVVLSPEFEHCYFRSK